MLCFIIVLLIVTSLLMIVFIGIVSLWTYQGHNKNAMFCWRGSGVIYWTFQRLSASQNDSVAWVIFSTGAVRIEAQMKIIRHCCHEVCLRIWAFKKSQNTRCGSMLREPGPTERCSEFCLVSCSGHYREWVTMVVSARHFREFMYFVDFMCSECTCFVNVFILSSGK